MELNDSTEDSANRMRIDKWLWCARLCKSRAQANAAISGGKVRVNGERVKPSRTIGVGDTLHVRQGAIERDLIVRRLPVRRGPAAEASACYAELPDSISRRERLKEQHALAAALVPRPDARPDKRERRRLLKLRRQQ